MNCKNCDRPLEYDEIALHKKLLGKQSREFFCLDCLAAYYRTDTDKLREMIRRFRADGCTLFT